MSGSGRTRPVVPGMTSSAGTIPGGLRILRFSPHCTGHYKGSLWSTWPDAIKYRDPAALDVMRRTLNKNIETEKFLQYMFSREWQALRNYCKKKVSG